MSHTIALAGNPNSGKTTLFNTLTGARQHVGNYPGVTVEKKTGIYKSDGHDFHLVDLPGTYSMTAYSMEEVIARDFIATEKPAVVVDIVDAANLERNLYLTLQIIEMGVQVCIALNMIDVAKSRGVRIDADRLSELLGVPVVPTVARSGKGKKQLMAAAAEIAEKPSKTKSPGIFYGDDIDAALSEMTPLIEQAGLLTEHYPAHWVALKYLEADEQIVSAGDSIHPALSARLKQVADRVANHLRATCDTHPEALIADQRFGFIKAIIRQGVIEIDDGQNRLHLSDKIDKVLLNRLAGPLIMIGILLLLYHVTFAFSDPVIVWLESAFAGLRGIADAHMAQGLLKSLVISGMIDGVGGVLGFVPIIMFMFFGITILEDSGYLTRVAFMLDRVFRVFGLHGSSVMAFIVSGGIAGGCAVPGVMATRTLKSPKERLATLLTVPFMNCGAKLPVFAMLISAFFAYNKAWMMFVITLISWGGALLIAKLLRITVIRGAPTPFIMELPPYRMPTVQGVLIHTWERTWQYVRKAGTIILAISILLWAMMTFPHLPAERAGQFETAREQIIAQAAPETARELRSAGNGDELSASALALRQQVNAIDAEKARAALKYSMAGRIGTGLESVSHLAGFDWRTNIALVGGFAAKEVIVSTLGTAYSMGTVEAENAGGLSRQLAESPVWRPLTAFSLILFVMFYSPCFVSVVCIAREAGSWKWGAFAMAFNTVLAFILAVSVYQAGTLLGF
ncbi:MAG: ferrous iron transport protein B [Desulfobacteraceae bacterium]|nr:ferrous iron transport protein B [Desulfobacteraceae bacterium]